MTTRVITPSSFQPLTLDEAKVQLKVLHNKHDAAISSMIVAAHNLCAHRVERSLCLQTWEKVLDRFPPAIELLYPPIVGIASVQYMDPETQALVTMDADQYSLDKDSEPGWLMPAYGTSWPSTMPVANAVRVQYNAGYPDAAAVPDALKRWMLMAITTWYDHSGGVITGTIVSQLPRDFYDSLLDHHRIWSV